MVGASIGDFRRQIELAMKEEVAPAIEEALRITVTEVFKAIYEKWPVQTGWSLVNNRIDITGEGNFAIQPPHRPTQLGALIGAAPFNKSNELSKLHSLTTFQSVMIGNAVPYAE